jgi:hypothetical protein
MAPPQLGEKDGHEEELQIHGAELTLSKPVLMAKKLRWDGAVVPNSGMGPDDEGLDEDDGDKALEAKYEENKEVKGENYDDDEDFAIFEESLRNQVIKRLVEFKNSEE